MFLFETTETDDTLSDEDLDLGDDQQDQNQDGDEDADATKVENDRLKRLNQTLYTRAKKAEGFEKGADGKWVKKDKPADPPINKKKEPSEDDDQIKPLADKVSKLEMVEEKRQFGFEHSLSPEETDFVFKFSGGKPTKEVLESPFVKHGLEGFRASKRVEKNTPSSSSRSMSYQNKPFEKLSEEERVKAFEEKRKAFMKK